MKWLSSIFRNLLGSEMLSTSPFSPIRGEDALSAIDHRHPSAGLHEIMTTTQVSSGDFSASVATIASWDGVLNRQNYTRLLLGISSHRRQFDGQLDEQLLKARRDA